MGGSGGGGGGGTIGKVLFAFIAGVTDAVVETCVLGRLPEKQKNKLRLQRKDTPRSCYLKCEISSRMWITNYTVNL